RLAREMVRATGGPLAKLGPLCNWAGVRRTEGAHLGRCDEGWAPTDDEARELAALGGGAARRTLPDPVAVAPYLDCPTTATECDPLLFVANFAYAPNANAARHLLARFLPAIRRTRPHARLWLVGGGMQPELRRLAAATPGVEAPGFVPDLADRYRRA